MSNAGMKRMIKLMTAFAEKTFLIIAGFSVGMALYMFLLGGHYSLDRLMEEVKMIPGFIPSFGNLFFMIFGVAYTPIHLDMQLSMGATRKEVIVGQLYARLLIAVQLLVFALVAYLIVPSESYPNLGIYMLATLAMLLLTNGVGLIISTLVDRFGKVAYYVFVGAAALLAGVLGGAASYFMLTESEYIVGIGVVLLIVLAIGVALTIAGPFIFAGSVKKRMVRV